MIGFFWLVAFALVAVIFIVIPTDRLTAAGFPHLPFYGAMTWWFFFVIPLIGVTWGFFNDWKGDRAS